MYIFFFPIFYSPQLQKIVVSNTWSSQESEPKYLASMSKLNILRLFIKEYLEVY